MHIKPYLGGEIGRGKSGFYCSYLRLFNNSLISPISIIKLMLRENGRNYNKVLIFSYMFQGKIRLGHCFLTIPCLELLILLILSYSTIADHEKIPTDSADTCRATDCSVQCG